MGEQSDTVPASEFEHWLTPADALAALKEMGDFDTRRSAMLERLGSDLMTAAAETYLRDQRGEGPRRKHWQILPSVWRDHPPSYHSSFWDTAQFNFTERQGYGGDVEHRYFGVRFEPTGIAALAKAAGIQLKAQQQSMPLPEALAPPAAEERKTRHGLPALRDELLDNWHALFAEAYPQGSKELAEESARGMFPKHSVDRQKVRDLIGVKPKGRPLKTKD